MSPRALQGTRLVSASIAIVFLVLGFADFGTEAAHRCIADFPFWYGCLLSTHEGLAAGLVGTAGGIFAGWLAYSAALDQVELARLETRQAGRKALDGQIADLLHDIDGLELAGAYLVALAARFPDPTDATQSDENFGVRYIEIRRQAYDAPSVSATAAPFGVGQRIATVTTRLQMIGERLDIDERSGRYTSATLETRYGKAIREIVAGMSAVAEQIKDEVRHRQEELLRRMDDREALDA